MKFEIRYRWSREIKIVLEGATRNEAIKKAIQDKVDLRDSDLRGSDLRGSNLSGSDLRDSDLSDSDLRGADLSDSDLRGADLRGSNLRGANLSGSNLRGADLQPIKNDLWAVLSAQPAEVEGLRAAIAEGRIEGSTYNGECACLVGTIANVAKVKPEDLPRLKMQSSRPAEMFFLGIKKGDKPKNNQFSKLALEWVDEWLTNVKGAFAVR